MKQKTKTDLILATIIVVFAVVILFAAQTELRDTPDTSGTFATCTWVDDTPTDCK